jgi:hypothetical protein
MTDTNEKLAAMELRIAQLEATVLEAHKKTDALHEFVLKIDTSYYGMMKNAIHKYGVVKEFCETAGPIIIECDRLLFPEKSIERSKRLNFVLQGNDKVN